MDYIDIYYDKTGITKHVKFTIPINGYKKWWNVWKKSKEHKVIIEDLIKKYREDRIKK